MVLAFHGAAMSRVPSLASRYAATRSRVPQVAEQ